MSADLVRVVGTSHIARESIIEVERVFSSFDPDIVAVELDRSRFLALSGKKKSSFSVRDVFRVGVKGFVFALIGHWVERELGKRVGVEPGADMMRGVALAKAHRKLVALIDQEISVTLQRLGARLSWREKWHFVVDVVCGLFGRGTVAIDVSRVPVKKVIEQLLLYVRVRYPHVYAVLITERNRVMAGNVVRLLHAHPGKKILVVVGAGHEEEVARLVEKLYAASN